MIINVKNIVEIIILIGLMVLNSVGKMVKINWLLVINLLVDEKIFMLLFSVIYIVGIISILVIMVILIFIRVIVVLMVGKFFFLFMYEL